jgi:hypothetical protein
MNSWAVKPPAGHSFGKEVWVSVAFSTWKSLNTTRPHCSEAEDVRGTLKLPCIGNEQLVALDAQVHTPFTHV